MTSAYDTSSNCSDANNSADDPEHRRQHHHDIPTSLLEELITPEKVTALLSTTNQNFYQMTTIETDSEATSTAERHVIIEESRSGAATDADSELSKSLELPFDSTPIRYFTDSEQGSTSIRSSAKTHLDAVFEKIEPIESPVGSPGQVVPLARCPSDSDQSMDEDFGQHQSDSGESNALFEMEGLNGCKNVKHQVASDCSDGGLRFHDDVINPADSVSRMLLQASLLAQESFRAPRTIRSCNSGEKRCRYKQHNSDAKDSVLSQSLTSTEGSVLNTHSTCEASSEGTSESSESDEEFSSTSSGSEAEDAPYGGAFEEVSRSVDVTLCASHNSSFSSPRRVVSVSDGHMPLLRHTQGKSRLLDMSSATKLENLKYSVSEGAIHNLKTYHDEPKLRRTTSAMPFYPIQKQPTPRHVRRRRLRKVHSRDYGSEFGLGPAKLMYSQSLPTSRMHSSRSHSRSLSPASLSCVHIGDGSSGAKREYVLDGTTVSSGDGEHVVPSVKLGTETDDDAVHQSLTSAAEFSENAWDNLVFGFVSFSMFCNNALLNFIP